MSEKKTSLVVPEAFLPLVEDFRLLKMNGQNPNKMTDKMTDQLWHSLQEFGWTDPIITDTAGFFVIVDSAGNSIKDHWEFFVPVLQLSKTVQRRIGRQDFKKLRYSNDRNRANAATTRNS